MVISNKKLCTIIAAIRDSHPDLVDLYLYGQCYSFHLILRSIEPTAKPWYDFIEGHMYTKIGKYWYDIRGVHYKVSETCIPHVYKDGYPAHRWGRGDTRRLK